MHLGRRLLISIIVFTLLVFTILTCFFRTDRKSFVAADSLKNWTVKTIPEGGSLYSVLGETVLPMQEIGLFAIQFGENIDVTTIQPGDTLKFILTPDSTRLEQLMYIQEIDERHHFYLQNDTLKYSLIKLPTTTKTRLINGTLNATLDKSLSSMGLTPSEKQHINNGLEGEIDFRNSARNGDRFQVLLEERYLGSIRLPRAKILYVSYTGKLTGSHELFRYEEDDEKSTMNGLYNLEGKSNNTSGVGFPLRSIHVVSKFGRRIDPIYRSWRMHQGIDYRARYGTPVYAIAKGTVKSAGWNGGYGKCVVIKHPTGYSTLYAHLSSIGVKKGKSVQRGQVIGRVGNTGKSTGAHLHFSLMKGRKYINPTQLRMVGAEKLNSEQMVRFKQQQQNIRQFLKQDGIS